jgi:TetR/AcrR family transcriptional repressor of nem operon
MSDPDVARIGSANSVRLEGVLKELVREAKTKGEIRASVNERAAARHLQATILGLKVMSKGGASPETLRDVAIAALEGMALEAK